MIAKSVGVFRTTTLGRLFDTIAALLGFTREITFEGQAAMWLEHLATAAAETTPYHFRYAMAIWTIVRCSPRFSNDGSHGCR
jgi:hydrogenase maturation protein HypF